MREHLCSACRREAPFVLPPICSLCGRSEDDCTCGKKKRAYARCVMPFAHEGVVRQAIGALKNEGFASTVDGLALEMSELIRREYGGIAFDYIAPVPSHPADEKRRGFNQSALLALSLSTVTGIPYAEPLVKLFRTPHQKDLGLQEREANLLGAFDVTVDVTEKTVLLVDDLLTTGSTLNECAKMLKLYGACEVYAITAAVRLMKDKNKKENTE